MSSIYHCGDIEINKPLAPEHKEKVADILEIKCDTGWNHVGDDYITFGEYYCGYDFPDILEEVVNYLKPFGYVLNGSISYYGDYGDGRNDIEDNNINEIDLENLWRKDASDEELIEVLESRGYVVTKKGDET